MGGRSVRGKVAQSTRVRHDRDVNMKTLPVVGRGLNRVALLSVHTSPLDQPGIGDAGGLNVYVVELSKRLAQAGVEVDVFTRTTRGGMPPTVAVADGVTVHHVPSGPLQGIDKNDLPAHLCALTAGVLRAEASRAIGWYDLVHSHYWLSGHVGSVASERWNVPLVHSMHTMAKVKNSRLAVGDTPEPHMRVVGEQQVVDSADWLVANTKDEADDLVQLYGADPQRVSVVHPGVDLQVFTPGSQSKARATHGIAEDAQMILFVGRIQPLKAPDVVIRSAARLVERDPQLRTNLVVVICGGPSGAGPERLDELRQLAQHLGIADLVRFEPPADRHELADWYRAADVVCVPSHSESFGLVAVEAQACATPVVAAAVGGLRTAVDDGVSGLLVDGHHADDWADVIAPLLGSKRALASLARGARKHAENFGWSATAASTIEAYRQASHEHALNQPAGVRLAAGGRSSA